MAKEIWKDICYVDVVTGTTYDYAGYYQVSNLGRIKSLSRTTSNNHIVDERIINGSIDKDGYRKVSLRKNSKLTSIKVHKIVAHMFIYNPNPQVKKSIDHINTNRDDNRVSNLRWVTNKENHNNELSKYNHGKVRAREVLIIDRSNDNNFKRFDSSRECASFFNSSHTTINKKAKEKGTFKGYTIYYFDEYISEKGDW